MLQTMAAFICELLLMLPAEEEEEESWSGGVRPASGVVAAVEGGVAGTTAGAGAAGDIGDEEGVTAGREFEVGSGQETVTGIRVGL